MITFKHGWVADLGYNSLIRKLHFISGISEGLEKGSGCDANRIEIIQGLQKSHGYG